MPSPQVTCVCIGGKNLDVVFISTAKENWTSELDRKYPLAGSIFYAKLNLFSKIIAKHPKTKGKILSGSVVRVSEKFS